MARVAKTHFNSLCTLQDQITTFDTVGEQIITYVDNALLRAIPCYIEPAGGAEVGRALNEDRTAQSTTTLNRYVIALAGYYPNARQTQQASVNGNSYNVLRIAFDDQKTETYLTVEIVNDPNG